MVNMNNLYFIESDNHIILNKFIEDIVKDNKFSLDNRLKEGIKVEENDLPF